MFNLRIKDYRSKKTKKKIVFILFFFYLNLLKNKSLKKIFYFLKIFKYY
jgi:hypothetical protein